MSHLGNGMRHQEINFTEVTYSIFVINYDGKICKQLIILCFLSPHFLGYYWSFIYVRL